MADMEKSKREAGDSTVIDALLDKQTVYAAIIGPILQSVRQMAEAVESLPSGRQPAGFELLREFGAAVTTIAREGDRTKLQATCDEYVSKFRVLAGN